MKLKNATRNREWRLFTALVMATMLLLAACSSDDGDSDGATESSADNGQFPVTITHSFGETTIESEPKRVVVLSDRDADTVLALGVVPVAIRSAYGFESGVGPWAQSQLGDAKPTVWTDRELKYEDIAAADPDLIVYPTSGGDKEEYDRLAAIAPTVYLPEGVEAYSSTNEQVVPLIAEALGRKSEGERILADLDGYLTDKAAEYPAFAGKTVNYFDISGTDIYSYRADTLANELLYRVGFQPIPAAESIPADKQMVQVSAENLAGYDADVVVAYPFGGESLADLERAIPTLAALGAVVNGRFFILGDLAYSNASVLSIPYALNELLPKINDSLS
jgi:iron complex transport system substrate-binding protein